MAHVHRIARYMQLLRADPTRPAPEPRRVSVAAIQHWKKQMRAYDEARVRLRHVTPGQVQRQNTGLHISPRTTRLVATARYA